MISYSNKIIFYKRIAKEKHVHINITVSLSLYIFPPTEHTKHGPLRIGKSDGDERLAEHCTIEKKITLIITFANFQRFLFVMCFLFLIKYRNGRPVQKMADNGSDVTTATTTRNEKIEIWLG